MSRFLSLRRWFVLCGLALAFAGQLCGQELIEPAPLPDAEVYSSSVPGEFCPPGGEMDYGLGSGAGGGLDAFGFGYLGPGPVPCRTIDQHNPDLFYNFYVPQSCGSLPTSLYLCPRPVPQLVGHTYYTYQPFLPHEFLYAHKRTYYRYYNDGRGLNRTQIKWQTSAYTHADNFFHWMRIPR